MRNILPILSFAALSGLTATAQQAYNVSTDVQKRKILLEEYTGLHCGWCPEGHKVSKVMLNSLPGESFAVNIHAGHYAEPGTGEPDYRTAEGDALKEYFGADQAGYPCGVVNREQVDGAYATSRSLWLAQADYYHKDDAPVNLYVRSDYDGLSRQLAIHVEGYYTADAPQGTQTLSVVWTQSDIVGYQNGGGNDYHHQHMLRDFVTPLWGDTIAEAKNGQYFTRDYTYTLPEAVNGIAVVPGDIEVVAFVATDRVAIGNVEGGRPVFANYRETEAAELQAPDIAVGNRYGNNYFEATLKNLSSKRLTSATFDVTVNGATETKTVACDIDQFDKAILAIPCTMQYAAKGKTKYSVTLTRLNGVDVEASTLSGSFQKPTTIATTNVTFQITTDERASQNTFVLRDADGNVVREFGPYADGQSATYEEEATGLENGKTYCFEAHDAWGDGMLEGTKGAVIVRSGAGKLIDQYYTINGYGIRSFFTIDTATGIAGVEANEESTTTATYTLGGTKAAAQAKGVLIKEGKKGYVK